MTEQLNPEHPHQDLVAGRRGHAIAEWLKSLLIGIPVALGVAALIDLAFSVIGSLVGRPGWHRGWIADKLGDSAIGIVLPQSAPGAPVLQFPGADVLALALILYLPLLPYVAAALKRLLARFDDEVLQTIPPVTGQLTWQGPLDAEQRRVLNELGDWAWGGAMPGDTPPLRPWRLPRLPTPFSFALLVGPNGVGKTQLSLEFAKALREGALPAAGGWRSTLERLWGTLSLSLWFRRRRRGDLWDAGLLDTWDPARLSRLVSWRPRRATIIVIDDPSPRAARTALQTLRATASEFRHPVRVLVVDQAITDSLDIRWDFVGERWASRLLPSNQSVLVASMVDVRFGIDGLRGLAHARQAAGTPASSPTPNFWGTDDALQPVIEGCDGNPLMLTLYVLSTRESGGAGLPSLDPQRMLEEGVNEAMHRSVVLPRAQDRVEHLLQTVAPVPGLLQAITVATLVGGAEVSRLQKALEVTPGVWSSDDLRRAHAVYAGGSRESSANRVPAVEPSVVGDAVLELIIESRLPADREEFGRRLAVAAWQVNPDGAMRTVRRLRGLTGRPALIALATEMDRAAMPPKWTSGADRPSAQTIALMAASMCEVAVAHGGDVAVASAWIDEVDPLHLELVRESISLAAGRVSPATPSAGAAGVLELRLVRRRIQGRLVTRAEDLGLTAIFRYFDAAADQSANRPSWRGLVGDAWRESAIAVLEWALEDDSRLLTLAVQIPPSQCLATLRELNLLPPQQLLNLAESALDLAESGAADTTLSLSRELLNQWLDALHGPEVDAPDSDSMDARRRTLGERLGAASESAAPSGLLAARVLLLLDAPSLSSAWPLMQLTVEVASASPRWSALGWLHLAELSTRRTDPAELIARLTGEEPVKSRAVRLMLSRLPPASGDVFIDRCRAAMLSILATAASDDGRDADTMRTSIEAYRLRSGRKDDPILAAESARAAAQVVQLWGVEAGQEGRDRHRHPRGVDSIIRRLERLQMSFPRELRIAEALANALRFRSSGVSLRASPLNRPSLRPAAVSDLERIAELWRQYPVSDAMADAFGGACYFLVSVGMARSPAKDADKAVAIAAETADESLRLAQWLDRLGARTQWQPFQQERAKTWAFVARQLALAGRCAEALAAVRRISRIGVRYPEDGQIHVQTGLRCGVYSRRRRKRAGGGDGGHPGCCARPCPRTA